MPWGGDQCSGTARPVDGLARNSTRERTTPASRTLDRQALRAESSPLLRLPGHRSLGIMGPAAEPPPVSCSAAVRCLAWLRPSKSIWSGSCGFTRLVEACRPSKRPHSMPRYTRDSAASWPSRSGKVRRGIASKLREATQAEFTSSHRLPGHFEVFHATSRPRTPKGFSRQNCTC